MRVCLAVVVVAGALLGTGVGAPAALAARLGTLQVATLATWSAAASAPDPSWAYASFDGANGAGVGTGTALTTGGTWTKSAGNFQIQSNALRNNSGTARAYLWVDLGSGRQDVQVSVYATLVSTAAARSGGVVLRGTASGYLRVLYRTTGAGGTGYVELSKVVGNAVTVLGSAAVAGATAPTSGLLVARMVGSTLTASFGGAAPPQLSVTLGAADAATFASGTQVGVTMDGDTLTALDEFRAMAP